MKDIIINHWLLTAMVILFIATLIKAWYDVKKDARESEAYQDKFWNEHTEMLVDNRGKLYIIWDKKFIVYVDEEEKMF